MSRDDKRKARQEEKAQKQHDKDATDEANIQRLKDYNAKMLEAKRKREQDGE